LHTASQTYSMNSGMVLVRLFALGLRAARFFTRGLLAGLGHMRRTVGEILSVLLLFVDDFSIVRDISGI
jgi:hypothetical protein